MKFDVQVLLIPVQNEEILKTTKTTKGKAKKLKSFLNIQTNATTPAMSDPAFSRYFYSKTASECVFQKETVLKLELPVQEILQ